MNIKKFAFLNQLAKSQGTVLLGASTFDSLPVNEFAQDFEIKEHIYNRSSVDATIADITEHLNSILSNLYPANILINLGETEISDAKTEINLPQLVEQYRWLLYKIHTLLPNARLIITSLPQTSDTAINFNNSIKAIGKEFGCEYINLPDKKDETSIDEYNLSLFKRIRSSFYRRDLTSTDLANSAILRFS